MSPFMQHLSVFCLATILLGMSMGLSVTNNYLRDICRLLDDIKRNGDIG